MKNKLVKRSLIVLLTLLLTAQFIRLADNNGEASGPNDITHAMAVPAEVHQLLKTSCYDCHSNHTEYPWYSAIQPLGWWLEYHVNEGRKELNFSEFATYSDKRKAKKMKELADEVEEHEMPLESYLWIHSGAKLSEAQVQQLVEWAKSNAGETTSEHHED